LAHFNTLTERMTDEDRAAIYLIGHGSFDGETYKFNIPGLDLSATDFKDLLAALPGHNNFLLNTSSTSGALIEALVGTGENASNPDYVLIAATRNGNERNATQFGRFFAEALTSDGTDVNKNQSVSIQEAYDYAQRAVERYFEDAGRLATEHSQIRGDGAAQFNLARLNALQLESELQSASDELRALLEQRQAIDVRIEDLQLRRAEFDNATYLQQLQTLVLQSAELSEQIDALQNPPAGTAP
ncbi:MAG: C13 family peptidase, partial [Pseudomonadales bacterium]|nr:C13 family peptidase [Pseudomonadales bacterium]